MAQRRGAPVLGATGDWNTMVFHSLLTVGHGAGCVFLLGKETLTAKVPQKKSTKRTGGSGSLRKKRDCG